MTLSNDEVCGGGMRLRLQIGGWRLGGQRLENSDWKVEVGDWRVEVRGWKFEGRDRRVEVG